MVVKIHGYELQTCSDDAIIAIVPGQEYASVLERDRIGYITTVNGIDYPMRGGLIGDRAQLERAFLFPVSMLLVEKLSFLPGGDWTVIPYIKDVSGDRIQRNGEYRGFEIEVQE